MDIDRLIANYPVLYHMAEPGTWPSILANGLLSTKAIVDVCRPDMPELILGQVRQGSITVGHPMLGDFTIRDQRPLKFLAECLSDGTTPREYLDALNERVFFWLTRKPLERLLKAKLYRASDQTVLHIDTRALLAKYGSAAQLAPYNTGSMHVPNAPTRGADVFVDIADYPYDQWRAQRGPSGDAVVELTVPYSIPDIAKSTSRVETWRGGQPVEVLYVTSTSG